MKTKKLFFVIALVTGTMIFNGCKKDDDSNFQPKGNYQTAGTNGDVKSVQLVNANWIWDGVTNYWSTSTWTGISILTANINATGSVMLYEANGAGGWIGMPLALNLSSTVTRHDIFSYNTGAVTVTIEDSDLSNPNVTGGTFKLVCISSSARMANPNLNLSDYKAVAKAFNLKD